MMTRVVLALSTVALACASSGATPASEAPSGPIEGTYDYLVSLPSQQVRGRLQVIADTVLVQPLADYCRPSMTAPDPLYISYTCQGGSGTYEQLTLTIDRRNPAQLSKWSASIRVQRRREACVQYAMRDGRQVCVRTTTETYETTERKTGVLQVRRVPP